MARCLRRRARFGCSVSREDRSMSRTRWITVVGVLVLLPASALAQSTADAAVPRTPWGHPDLQGVWDYRSTTPFERPEELGGHSSGDGRGGNVVPTVSASGPLKAPSDRTEELQLLTFLSSRRVHGPALIVVYLVEDLSALVRCPSSFIHAKRAGR